MLHDCDKFRLYKSSHLRCSVKKVFLKIFQISQESISNKVDDIYFQYNIYCCYHTRIYSCFVNVIKTR